MNSFTIHYGSVIFVEIMANDPDDKNNNRFEKTIFDDTSDIDDIPDAGEAEAFVEPEGSEKTRVHTGALSDKPRFDRPEPTAENQDDFKWESPSGVSKRISPQSYYADESIVSKLFNTFTIIMLFLGLVLGGGFGYWMRGFFTTIEPEVHHQEYPTVPSTPPTVVPAEVPPTAPPPTVASPTTEVDAEAPVESVTTPETNAVVPVKPAAVAAKKPTLKKQIKQIKISSAGAQVIAEIETSAMFKYTSRVFAKPSRLILDLDGINATLTKKKIAAPANAKPLAAIHVEKHGATSMRVSLEFKQKNPPRYTINRSKNSLKIVIRK